MRCALDRSFAQFAPVDAFRCASHRKPYSKLPPNSVHPTHPLDLQQREYVEFSLVPCQVGRRRQQRHARALPRAGHELVKRLLHVGQLLGHANLAAARFSRSAFTNSR